MKLGDFNRPLGDNLYFAAHAEALEPAVRLRTLEGAENFAVQRLALGANTDTNSEAQMRLTANMWLAFMPSLRVTAAGLPHHADVADEVLDNLRPLLDQTVIENTKSARGSGLAYKVEGQIAEMAVLGTLLWGHSNLADRASRSVLPATSQQDRSSPKKRLSEGFDIQLATPHRIIPIQVKASSREIEKRLKRRLPPTNQYRRGIVTLYVSRLIPDHMNYPAQMLADAVIRGDEAVLTEANHLIDKSIIKSSQVS